MKDKRGIERGGCKSCSCDEYEYEDSYGNRCSYCDHVPALHQNSNKDEVSKSTALHSEEVNPKKRKLSNELDCNEETSCKMATLSTGSTSDDPGGNHHAEIENTNHDERGGQQTEVDQGCAGDMI